MSDDSSDESYSTRSGDGRTVRDENSLDRFIRAAVKALDGTVLSRGMDPGGPWRRRPGRRGIGTGFAAMMSFIVGMSVTEAYHVVAGPDDGHRIVDDRLRCAVPVRRDKGADASEAFEPMAAPAGTTN